MTSSTGAGRKPSDHTYDLLRRFGYQTEAELAELSDLRLTTVRRHLADLESTGRARRLSDDGLWGAV